MHFYHFAHAITHREFYHYTHTGMHLCTCTFVITHTQVCTYTHVLLSSHTHTQDAHIHTYFCHQIHTHKIICMHLYCFACTHTHIYALLSFYTHTHTCTSPSGRCTQSMALNTLQAVQTHYSPWLLASLLWVHPTLSPGDLLDSLILIQGGQRQEEHGLVTQPSLLSTASLVSALTVGLETALSPTLLKPGALGEKREV